MAADPGDTGEFSAFMTAVGAYFEDARSPDPVSEAAAAQLTEMAAAPVGLRGRLTAPLFFNAFLLMISSGLQSGLGLVFYVIGARMYSPHWVGVGTTVISVTSLLTSVGQLGLSSVIVRYLPVANAQSRRFVIGCYGAALSVSLVAAGIALATVSLWSPPLVFLRQDGWWLALFVLLSATGTVFQLEDAVMVGLRQTKWVPVENATFAVSRVALVICFAHILPNSGLVFATAAPSILLPLVVNTAIFGRFLPDHLKRTGDRPPTWEMRDVRKLVVGNYVGSLAEMGSLYLLPVIITDRLGANHEAFFYIPWQLMTSLTVLAANMSASLSVETADGEALRQHVLSALKLVLVLLVTTAVVLGICAHPFLLIFGEKYADGGDWALRYMMLATIPTGATMISLAVARIHHDGRLIAIAQVVGAASLVAITLLLLPDYGVEGAGLAALLSATLSFGILAPTLWDALAHPAPVS